MTANILYDRLVVENQLGGMGVLQQISNAGGNSHYGGPREVDAKPPRLDVFDRCLDDADILCYAVGGEDASD